MTKKASIYNSEKIVSSISGTGKTWRYMLNNEIRIFTYTIHKRNFKIDERAKCKIRNHETQRRKHRTLFDINYSNIFLDWSQGKRNKSKNKQMELN